VSLALPPAPICCASAQEQAARNDAGSLEEGGLRVYSVRTSFRLILFDPLSGLREQMPASNWLPPGLIIY
jgi:hypothetical protein